MALFPGSPKIVCKENPPPSSGAGKGWRGVPDFKHQIWWDSYLIMCWLFIPNALVLWHLQVPSYKDKCLAITSILHMAQFVLLKLVQFWKYRSLRTLALLPWCAALLAVFLRGFSFFSYCRQMRRGVNHTDDQQCLIRPQAGVVLAPVEPPRQILESSRWKKGHQI